MTEGRTRSPGRWDASSPRRRGWPGSSRTCCSWPGSTGGDRWNAGRWTSQSLAADAVQDAAARAPPSPVQLTGLSGPTSAPPSHRWQARRQVFAKYRRQRADPRRTAPRSGPLSGRADATTALARGSATRTGLTTRAPGARSSAFFTRRPGSGLRATGGGSGAGPSRSSQPSIVTAAWCARSVSPRHLGRASHVEAPHSRLTDIVQ